MIRVNGDEQGPGPLTRGGDRIEQQRPDQIEPFIFSVEDIRGQLFPGFRDLQPYFVEQGRVGYPAEVLAPQERLQLHLDFAVDNFLLPDIQAVVDCLDECRLRLGQRPVQGVVAEYRTRRRYLV